MIGEWDYFDDHNVGGDHAIEIERTRKMDGHSEVRGKHPLHSKGSKFPLCSWPYLNLQYHRINRK